MFKYCIKNMPSYKEQKFWSKGSVKLSILMFTIHIPERLSYINNMQKYPHTKMMAFHPFLYFLYCVLSYNQDSNINRFSYQSQKCIST